MATIILLLCVLMNANLQTAYGASIGEASLIIVGRNGVYEFRYPELEASMMELKLKNQAETLKGICQNEKRNAINAEISFNPQSETPFSILQEKDGFCVDEERLKEDVSFALGLGGGVVRLKYLKIEPTIRKNQLEKCTVLKGSFSTNFSQNPDRIENIKLATAKINGLKVEKGESFSFNSVVGARSVERGYKMAKIIVNGEFVEGVGGGVCQVSTTLYNAVLVSGLKVTEQHRHSLAVNYVERSFDAMVNSSSSDFKFQNNTDSPVFISGCVHNNTLTFKVYGVKNQYEIKRESVIVKEIEPKENLVKNDSLPFGEKKVIIPIKKGYQSEGYLNYYCNEKLIERKKIREDEYLAVSGITEVGGLDN